MHKHGATIKQKTQERRPTKPYRPQNQQMKVESRVRKAKLAHVNFDNTNELECYREFLAELID